MLPPGTRRGALARGPCRTSCSRTFEAPPPAIIPSLIGSQLAHYQITARLGEGGMGVVYRARDTRLHRDVALKVLPAETASDPERLERFRREARTVAALNHPNIVTIFSVEEDSGMHFLTMEMVEGRSLAELLATEGKLDRERFYDIAVALTDAIAAAHARGIVHRDLKPANLMLDADGRLKVLDFGLAKLAAVDAGTTRDETQLLMTEVGRVIGTAPYMSPEQAEGRPVDARSDIFSLGSVLYELATGRRAFDGDSLPLVLYAVVSVQPPPVFQTRTDLGDIDGVLARCLVKDVASRSSSAADLRGELASLRLATPDEIAATAALPPTIPRSVPASRGAPEASDRRAVSESRRPVIAVLPFRSVHADPDIEDFAMSLASDVVDGVSSTSQAVVLPGSATDRYRSEAADARTIGEELGASYVVQGTVRRSGDRLRVTAQLVSVEAGTQVWSRRYDRNLAEMDLLDAGDDIGTRIVSAVSDVHGVIFERERQRLEGRPVSELDAWECIFVTLGYDKFLDAEHHALARDALERAVTLDPGFALAWGYMSWVVTDEMLYGFNPRPEPMERAMAAARRAVELDPYSHMLRWLLGRVHFFLGDVEGFLSEGRKALELSSNDATVIGLIGFYTCLTGRWERGEELIRRAIDLNPSYPSYYHFALALKEFVRGDYESALVEHRRLDFSGNLMFDGVLASILGHLGRKDEAAAILQRIAAAVPDLTSATVRSTYRRWNLTGDVLDSLMAGLRAAGLEDR